MPAGGSVAHSGDDGAEGQESWKVAGKKEAGNNYCNCADKSDGGSVRHAIVARRRLSRDACRGAVTRD